jgi:hypothetical protein
VIGGEPFAMPEAIAFMRGFIDDPEYEDVRLGVCTNGTVHHKHMETLRKKKKLSLAVSLDSIGQAFEKIRVNGKWDIVERNLLEFIEFQRSDRPEWQLQTNALILKTGITSLPEFADWHVRHGVITSFYDFINSRGTEDAFFAENPLHNPQILDDLPGWEDYFCEATEKFRAACMPIAADTLDHYRARLATAVRDHRKANAVSEKLRRTNSFKSILKTNNADEFIEKFAYSRAPGETESVLQRSGDAVIFSKVREGDHVATRYFAVLAGAKDGAVRVKLKWPANAPRRAHVYIQNIGSHEIVCARETFLRPSGVFEMVLTANLPRGRHSIRLVVVPVGEDESALPTAVEFEAIGDAIQQNASIASMIKDRAVGRCAQLKRLARFALRSAAPNLYAKLSQIENNKMIRDQPPEK